MSVSIDRCLRGCRTDVINQLVWRKKTSESNETVQSSSSKTSCIVSSPSMPKQMSLSRWTRNEFYSVSTYDSSFSFHLLIAWWKMMSSIIRLTLAELFVLCLLFSSFNYTLVSKLKCKQRWRERERERVGEREKKVRSIDTMCRLLVQFLPSSPLLAIHQSI